MRDTDSCTYICSFVGIYHLERADGALPEIGNYLLLIFLHAYIDHHSVSPSRREYGERGNERVDKCGFKTHPLNPDAK